jgi:hypothetical protein
MTECSEELLIILLPGSRSPVLVQLQPAAAGNLMNEHMSKYIYRANVLK